MDSQIPENLGCKSKLPPYAPGANGGSNRGASLRALKRLGRCAIAALAPQIGGALAQTGHCAETTVRDTPYVVCRFDPKTDDIRLFHADVIGAPYKHFGKLEDALAAKGEKLVFAMNAGMYQANRAPVGLFIENGVTRRALNNRNCKGNFCLKPNGVFWLSPKNGGVSARVAKTADYLAQAQNVRDATQSGPMLVIDGALHPKFNKDSASTYRRNGVGVTESGEVVFAISDAPVTFHAFATMFRDELHCPNALYLDGAISRLYSTDLDRNEPGAAMGPMVGVVTANSSSASGAKP